MSHMINFYNMRNQARELMELTAHFGVLIGHRWNDIYEISKDSVESTYFAIEMAEGFFALWTSGMLETLDNWDESWIEHIDDYFAAWLADYTGQEKGNPTLESVRCLIEEGDITEAQLATFETFWAEIDVINTYEDGWEDMDAEQNKFYWKSHYREAWHTIMNERADDKEYPDLCRTNENKCIHCDAPGVDKLPPGQRFVDRDSWPCCSQDCMEKSNESSLRSEQMYETDADDVDSFDNCEG